MPSDNGQMVQASARDIATLPLNQAIDAYAPAFEAVLPSNVSIDHFKRMVVTAINTNPELAEADRRSLFNACVKCASDGLLPDGREAALVAFNTKIKKKVGNAWQEEWRKLVSYMPMIAGIRKRMRNSGEVISATAEVVCENDEFDYALGDEPFIRHKPAPFTMSRGKPVGAYAIIKLRHGEPLRDVMRREEIEAARSKSRAKDSLMWIDFWGEGAKKTVLRRCAKSAPQQSATLESLLARDDEPPMLPDMTELAPPEPEPPRANELAYRPPPDQSESDPEYLVIDCDGEEIGYRTREKAEAALDDIFHEAARRGAGHLAAALENNAMVMSELGIPQPDSPAGTVHPMTAQHSAASPAGDTDTPAGNGYRAKQSRNARKDASLPDGGSAAPAPAPTPAGDTISDMFTGEPRTPSSLHVALQDETSVGWEGWKLAIWALIDRPEPSAAILADNRENLVIFEQVDQAEHGKIMRALGGGR